MDRLETTMKFESYPKVNKFLAPILVLAALFGSYVVAQATGFWSVSGKDMIDLESMTSSEEIRGWMTLEQVFLGFGIPQEAFYQALGIPADIPPTTALKDLEGLIEGFEVTTVREAVDASLSGTPLEPEPAPVEQVATPTPTPPPSTAPAAEATAHVPQGEGTGEGTGTGPTPLPPGQVLPGSEIKGRHTLNDIAEQCQVPLAELLAALSLPADTDVHTAVKDLVEEGKISEIQVIRDVVTALQNK
jgi:hypothetical protein